MYNHTVEATCRLVYAVIAYLVVPKRQHGWRELPEMVVLQEVAARIYSCRELSGYIVQKEHLGIGSLGAWFVPGAESVTASQAALLEKIKQFWTMPSSWYGNGGIKAEFRFIHSYDGDAERKYDLWSEQYVENFGVALAGTGLANRYAGRDQRKEPLHAAEAVRLRNLSDVVPTGWQPML